MKLFALVSLLFLQIPIIYAGDTVTVIGSKGKLKLDPNRKPVPVIPKKLILDPERMKPEALFKYQNIPGGTSVVSWEDAMHLQECVSYLTGIPVSKIPDRMDLLREWLPTQGFRIFRVRNLHVKATEAMISNGMYVLILMTKNKETNGNMAGALSPFFNIIKGFRTVGGKTIVQQKDGTEILLYLYDNSIFRYEEKEKLSFDYKRMAYVVQGTPFWVDGSPSLSFSSYRGRIEDIFVIVPRSFTKETLQKYVATTMESVPLSFRTPDFEEMILSK